MIYKLNIKRVAGKRPLMKTEAIAVVSERIKIAMSNLNPSHLLAIE